MKTLFTLLLIFLLGFANAQTQVKNIGRFEVTPALNYYNEGNTEIIITPSVVFEKSYQKYNTRVKNVKDYISEGGIIQKVLESNNTLDYLNWFPFEFEDSDEGRFMTLSYFNAQAKGFESIIGWETSGEINFSHFSIERQISDNEFLVVGVVKARGISSGSTNYFLIDKNPDQNAMNFYRIVQYSLNGTKEAFGLASVQIGEPTKGISWPNPFINSFSILIPQGTLTGKILITNVFGQIFYDQTIFEDNTTLNLSTEAWPPGTYFINICGTNYQKTTRIMKL